MNPKLLLQSATFLKSAAKLPQCPLDEGFEIAFVGRSNAGKSSAINTLTSQTKLARTSKTPGCTQLINFFELDPPSLRLVDLPGYGYAKVSKSTQQAWQRHINTYLKHRQSLKGLVVVMDARHPLKDIDQKLIGWAMEGQLPVLLLLTKADKLNQSDKAKSLKLIKGFLAKTKQNAMIGFFSSLTKEGLDNIQMVLYQWLVQDVAQPEALSQ